MNPLDDYNVRVNVEVFFNLADVPRKLYLWQWDYHQRPHSALADENPAEFAHL